MTKSSKQTPATRDSNTLAASGVQLSIVLPIFNERDNIVPLLDEIDASLRDRYTYEVIAVDDASDDGSDRVLSQACAQRPCLRVLRFRKNAGQTAAFDAGFRHSRAPIVVTLDADLQNDPADIPALIEKLQRDQLDLVSGWRRTRRDGFWLRRLPSRIANRLIRAITHAPVHDLGCSLKVYRREIVDELRLYGEMHRFIPPLAESLGARIGELEVNHRPRTAGRSKYGIDRSVKVMLDLITVWFMRGYQTKPIYVFGGAGMLMFFSSTLIAAYVLYQKWFEGAWVHRNPLFIISVVLALMGMQALGFGLIAEINIRTYFESQDKPVWLLAEKIGFDEDEPATPDA